MRTFGELVAVAVVSAVVLTPVCPSLAQTFKPGRDSAGIQRRTQKSAELQRQALQTLGSPAQAEQLVGEAYMQLKGVQDDLIGNASSLKAPDPIANLNIKKAGQALSVLQEAWDALKVRDKSDSPGRAADLARDRLEQSLRLTNTLLATAF